MNGSGAWETALRLLTRRSYSEAELTARLRAKQFPESEVATVLDRCRNLGYLDDRRYAGERARALLRHGRAAGRGVLLDLRRRGVPAEIAATALQESQVEHPPAEVLRAVLARRYPHYDHAVADERERRRVVSYFLRRGFELSLVLAILTQERDDA